MEELKSMDKPRVKIGVICEESTGRIFLNFKGKNQEFAGIFNAKQLRKFINKDYTKNQNHEEGGKE